VTPIGIGFLMMAILLILIALGVTVSTSMGITGIVGLLVMLSTDATFIKVGTLPFNQLAAYTFAVVPMFMLMANIISTTGIGARLYDVFYKSIGRARGGLAMASILACGVFAAISASTIATVVTIGLIAYPEMKRSGYKDTLSTASIAAGGCLGCYIPPSSILMYYGLITDQSISKLFAAGIIPGLILIVIYIIVIFIICRVDPQAGPKGQKYTLREIWDALKKCLDVIILIVLVIGGMFAGWFTPTEAGAVGACGAIVITLVRRTLTKKAFIDGVFSALKASGMIYAITIGSAILNNFMALTNITTAIKSVFDATHMSPNMVIVSFVAILLVLGCFLDGMSMLFLTMPVMYPIAMSYGFNPIWFGVIMTVCVEMAVITPPVGVNLYATRTLSDKIRMRDIFVGIWPFVVGQLILVAILLYVPNLATMLPDLLY